MPFLGILLLSVSAEFCPVAADGNLSSDQAKEKMKPFVLAHAQPLPSLSEGNFAAEPAFFEDFGEGWSPRDVWRIATWRQNGTQMSPERCRIEGKDVLVQTVKAGEPFQGGSMQTDREFGWGRWLARVKPSKVPGVLNSIFTKDWDDLKTHQDNPKERNDGKKGEVDIEFLTSTFGLGKGEVHLAIHLLKKKTVLEVDLPLDFNPSDDFHDWGFDILPDRVVWHVDGKILFTWMYTQEESIDSGYEFFFNSWTKKNWIKGPPAQDARYEIDWVKFYPLNGRQLH